MNQLPQSENRREPLTLVLLGACLVLSALVVVLAWQNWSMKQRLAGAHEMDVPPDALKPGDRVAAFDVLDDSGAPRRIDFGDASPATLLLVFSSTCPACKSNMPTWNELLARPLPASWRVVAIQTDRAAGDAPEATPLPFSVFGLDRSSAGASSPLDRVPYIPATIVLGPTGEVLSVRFGILGEDARSALETQLQS